MAVKPVPDGYHRLTPYLIVDGAAAAIEFYKKAFAAAERMRHVAPDGKIGHAELLFGDSVVMLADEFPTTARMPPGKYGGSPVTLHLYVEDVDAAAARALAAGAKEIRPVQNQFYGDRSGSFADPFGACLAYRDPCRGCFARGNRPPRRRARAGGSVMIPGERAPYSAIVDRAPLKLPGGARVVVWTIVNLEFWDISRPMARQVLPAPTGQVLLPDVPNWSWHEYGMRVGVWRFFDLFAARHPPDPVDQCAGLRGLRAGRRGGA